ncbi:MAG: ribosomal subunit interface protein [Flavobacteriales bacterium]|jgi:ribosomal subunit interface protein
MRSNAEVVYKDIDASPALTKIISKRIDKLHRFSKTIIHSRIVLDSPHKHKHKGDKMFRASIELDIKGAPLLVKTDDQSVHVAVRDAFESMERKLKKVSIKTRH